LFTAATDQRVDDGSGKETVDKNCPSCKKRVVRTAVSVNAITAGDRHRFLLRCVKQRFLNNVSSNSNISILKGLTVDAAGKLHTYCEEMLRRRCRTLAELATLTDNEITVRRAGLPSRYPAPWAEQSLSNGVGRGRRCKCGTGLSFAIWLRCATAPWPSSILRPRT
jgi:hypothetical protein